MCYSRLELMSWLSCELIPWVFVGLVISSYPCVANVDISGRFVAVQILEDYTKALGTLGIAFGTHTSTVRYGTSPFFIMYNIYRVFTGFWWTLWVFHKSTWPIFHTTVSNDPSDPWDVQAGERSWNEWCVEQTLSLNTTGYTTGEPPYYSQC